MTVTERLRVGRREPASPSKSDAEGRSKQRLQNPKQKTRELRKENGQQVVPEHRVSPYVCFVESRLLATDRLQQGDPCQAAADVSPLRRLRTRGLCLPLEAAKIAIRRNHTPCRWAPRSGARRRADSCVETP